MMARCRFLSLAPRWLISGMATLALAAGTLTAAPAWADEETADAHMAVFDEDAFPSASMRWS